MDHQALEPLTKRDRSNKTHSARLTRWLDRSAHYSINVTHILALTDYQQKSVRTTASIFKISFDNKRQCNTILYSVRVHGLEKMDNSTTLLEGTLHHVILGSDGYIIE